MTLKLQSAMEYLMTYGWAILIIAVVLGALFQLGVFNPNMFTPKAQPGSCQIIRPNGPGTTDLINTQGTCNNQLPQYVAKFNGQAYISIAKGPSLDYNPITLAAWIYPTSDCTGTDCTYLIGKTTYGGYMRVVSSQFEADLYIVGTGEKNLYYPLPSVNKWYYTVETYDGSTQKLYVNGAMVASQAFSLTPRPTTDFGIGRCIFCTPGQFFIGSISNVQIYNTSLSSNDISTLYHEGIGGVPIDIYHIVGWWPLNGNSRDYSGNLNNGKDTAMGYTNSWVASYSQPT